MFSALLYSTVDTRSCVSLSRLSRISHNFHMKMDSRRLFWTLFDVRLDSGSHRMSGYHFSALGFPRGGLGSCVGSLLRVLVSGSPCRMSLSLEEQYIFLPSRFFIGNLVSESE